MRIPVEFEILRTPPIPIEALPAIKSDPNLTTTLALVIVMFVMLRSLWFKTTKFMNFRNTGN